MREVEIFIWEEISHELPFVAFAPDPGVWARGGTTEEVMRHMRLEIESCNNEFGPLGNPHVTIELIFIYDELAEGVE